MTPSVPNADSEYYAATRAELRGFLPERYSRVLEIGCGRGGFSSNLAETAETWGVEPFRDAAEIAKKSLNNVLIGKYEEVQPQLPNAIFDLVICNDVIEHMADDFGFLMSVREKMCTGGYLMGSIPNMRYFPVLKDLMFNKEWEYHDEGVLDRTHLRFYTIRSFPKLLMRAGFDVVRFSGINRYWQRKGWITRSLLKTQWFEDTQWMQFAFLARMSSSS
ncbi:MAG: class I SAM-dependent methyltransferase [Steroidobacteraceae bacterium]